MAAPVKVARQQTTPELSGTFRTLPPEPTPAYTGTLRNLPEPSGTCLRNLHHFTPELSGTFRNLPPELTPFYKGTLRNRNLPEPASGTYTSTLRNCPEPSSGTCSCDPHRHTPELIWAEDPISLRCWGKMYFLELFCTYILYILVCVYIYIHIIIYIYVCVLHRIYTIRTTTPIKLRLSLRSIATEAFGHLFSQVEKLTLQFSPHLQRNAVL